MFQVLGGRRLHLPVCFRPAWPCHPCSALHLFWIKAGQTWAGRRHITGVGEALALQALPLVGHQIYCKEAKLSSSTSMETMWCPGTIARPKTRGSPAEKESTDRRGGRDREGDNENPDTFTVPPSNKRTQVSYSPTTFLFTARLEDSFST